MMSSAYCRRMITRGVLERLSAQKARRSAPELFARIHGGKVAALRRGEPLTTG